MPELPEVECLTRAVRGAIQGGSLVEASFLRGDLREKIPTAAFKRLLVGETIEDVFRRSKYMLIRTKRGHGVFHLGMTGNILVQPSAEPSMAHTHAVFSVRDKKGRTIHLHFVDPRRFGVIDVAEGADYTTHRLFANLGVEPLDHEALGAYLFEQSRRRKAPVKTFLMDARVVVGVGNIYASESLFRAGIKPQRAAGTVTRERFQLLADAIKETLLASIKAGGTTFRDYKNAEGNPGYFAVSLNVYDREGEPCLKCKKAIKGLRQSGRSTFYCARCQT